jgi:hypothetical protein
MSSSYLSISSPYVPPRSHQKPTGRGPTIPGAHAGSTAGDVMDHERKNECGQDPSL